MMLLRHAKNNIIMINISAETEQSKIRTTLYLTQENKQRLDRIPRGKKLL